MITVLSTTATRQEILKLLDENNVLPDSFCLCHFMAGHSYLIWGSDYNKEVAMKSGIFIEKQIDENERFDIQTNQRPYMTGNPILSPFI